MEYGVTFQNVFMICDDHIRTVGVCISLQISIISLDWKYSKSSLLTILRQSIIVVNHSHLTVLYNPRVIHPTQLHPRPSNHSLLFHLPRVW
jgi:hypothetical protein